MKLLKLLFAFGFLCKIVDASNEENVNVSVVKVSRSYNNTKSESGSWKNGVKSFCNGVKAANEKLRGTALDRSNSINLLEEFIAELTELTNSKWTILATFSAAILKSLSRCDKLDGSGLNVIFQFEKVFPATLEDCNDIIENLSPHIGEEQTLAIRDAVNDFGFAFSYYMKEIVKKNRPYGCSKTETDHRPVVQKLQNVTNILERIGKSCDERKATEEELQGVAILSFVYFFYANAVAGITGCASEVLQEQDCPVPQSYGFCSLSLDNELKLIIAAVKNIDFSLKDTLKKLLTVVLNAVASLSKTLGKILGLVDGVGKTVGSLTKGDSVGKTIGSLTNGIRII